MNLESEIKELQRQLAQVDLVTESSTRSGSKLLELLLLKSKDIKVKMYQEQGHAMPHIHIDYGRQHHVASFSIEPPARLEGTLDRKYDKEVTKWVASHKHKLLEIWKTLQAGGETTSLVAELAGNA
ncbi:MAG: DUF4160 domain-containing protein [Gammaproteobacteria bacterium]|nr:DUF4160 domain-containing protein [Gammaproteobacteria bacterium]